MASFPLLLKTILFEKSTLFRKFNIYFKKTVFIFQFKTLCDSFCDCSSPSTSANIQKWLLNITKTLFTIIISFYLTIVQMNEIFLSSSQYPSYRFRMLLLFSIINHIILRLWVFWMTWKRINCLQKKRTNSLPRQNEMNENFESASGAL